MCLIVAFVVACGGKKKEEAGGGAGTASGVGTGSAPVVTDDNSVEIVVDGLSVAKIKAADLGDWPRLDSLVPGEDRRLGTWEKLTFTAATPATLDRPSQLHPDKVPVIYAGKDGKPAFGMFDPVELAKKGEPAFKVEDVKKIDLKLSKVERGGQHQGSTGEAADPTKLVVKIGDKQITGPEILALPREPQPGNEDTKGWRVQQFLDKVGVTKFTSITLVDDNGITVPLTKKELEGGVAFIKLNKQGALRFRMYTKKGEGWESGADLRSLSRIDVK
jgi:hypothetical protein